MALTGDACFCLTCSHLRHNERERSFFIEGGNPVRSREAARASSFECAFTRGATPRPSRWLGIQYSVAAANLEVLVAAERLCAARSTSEPLLDCAAHFADTHFQGGLYRTVVSGADARDTRLRQHLFSYYDIVAGALVRSLPLAAVDPRTAPLPEHFIIVGFGHFGQCVARKLVKTGLQLYRDGGAWKVARPRITVVDRRGEHTTGAFLLANPQFADYCELSTLALSSHEPKFLDLSFCKPPRPRGARASSSACGTKRSRYARHCCCASAVAQWRTSST